MKEGGLASGYNFLLIAVGVATIFVGMFWPAPQRAAVLKPVLALPSVRPPERSLPAPGDITYCPGPMCLVQETARRYCETELSGTFAMEPDFTCARADGVHRIVCDDIADEHQCGHMSHSDLDYAKLQLTEFMRTAKLVDVDAAAAGSDWSRLDVLKLDCQMYQRFITCRFNTRSTGEEHPMSPVSCNWTGCTFFGEEQP